MDVALLVSVAYTNNSASLCVRVVSGSALLKALLSLLCGGVRTRGCPRRTWHNVLLALDLLHIFLHASAHVTHPDALVSSLCARLRAP
jgi:hypothetical protein